MGKFEKARTGFWQKHYRKILAGVLAAALAVGMAVLLPALLDPYDCRILEGVSIGGLEVGGMTAKEARQALRAASGETLGTLALEVRLPKETLKLAPGDTKIQVDVRRAVSDAYRLGRKGSQEERAAVQTQAREAGYFLGLEPYITCDDSYITAVLQDYASRYDTVLTQPEAVILGDAPALGTDVYDEAAPCQTIAVTLGLPEQHLDVPAAFGQIMALYGQGIGAARAEQYGITLALKPEALPEEPDLQAIYDQYCTEPVDDGLDMVNYVLVPGAYGCRFDMEAAQAQIAAADYGDTVTLSLEYAEPEILGEEVYFRDVLGTCETKHNDNENRNTNLRLVCQLLNGYVIQPGEEFSYNGAVGERTPERGFKPAPAYSGNRLIQDYGGGVCQGSTTLYNCLLLADMEVTERVCHGALVSYVPRGLDAAVNWATKTDLAFRNNSHFPVMILAEVSDGYVKMKLVGTDEKDYYIKMESTSSENEKVVHSNSYKCKYSKETDEQLSRELEARSTYYKNLG